MINQHSERFVPPAGTSLELVRSQFTDQSTLGRLYWEGKEKCFILEPKRSGPAPVCIPPGRYEIRLTHSDKFGVLMPILCDVPGRSGIRIHPGNKPKDTLGCWCPGYAAEVDEVEQSTAAYNELLADLKAAAGPIFVTVREET